jgi:hypothetical protein
MPLIELELDMLAGSETRCSWRTPDGYEGSFLLTPDPRQTFFDLLGAAIAAVASELRKAAA